MPMTTALGQLVTCLKGSHPQSHKTLWPRGLARSQGKLKPLYLQNHNAHDHQTWQSSDLPLEAPTHKASWPYD